MSAPDKTAQQDALLLIFAGVLAHPTIWGDVEGYLDSEIVGKDSPIASTLWAYLQTAGPEATLHDASIELAIAGVENVVGVLERLVADATDLTPEKVKRSARKLARSFVNNRRRGAVRKELDAEPLATLDVESIAADAARRFPHLTPDLSPLSPDECEEARQEKQVVIPTGFAGIDRLHRGHIVGEMAIDCARTGSFKSTFVAAQVRNQFFANAARHREDPWWDGFGSSWDADGSQGRRRELLRPLHAGHDYSPPAIAPRVLWFSLEEPLAQLLARFYADLLDLDRGAWLSDETYRENVERSHAEELAHIDAVLGGGRLTVVDYSERSPSGKQDGGIDSELVEQTLADLTRKLRAWVRTCEKLDADEGVERPRLCFIDYGQLVNIPETDDRFGVLDKVSTSLRKLAAKHRVALPVSLMLKRGDVEGEPSSEDVKGSSQFKQDCARARTLWPLGKGEKERLTEHLASGGEIVASPFDEPDDAGFDTGEDFDGGGFFDAASVRARRALAELRVCGEKDRFGPPSWSVPLAVDGKHARITDALPDIDEEGNPRHDEDGHPIFTSCRDLPELAPILKAPRKKKGEG